MIAFCAKKSTKSETRMSLPPVICRILLLGWSCCCCLAFSRLSADRRNNHLDSKFGGVVYRTSIFTPKEWSVLLADLPRARKHLQAEVHSIAQKRKRAPIPATSDTVRVLQDGSLTTLVRHLVDPSYRLETKLYPPELRTYEQKGAHMAWHVDDVLFDPPQVEVIITIENTSNVQTCWRKIEAVQTEVNSAILLRAGVVEHCVTHLKYGKRTILKCVFVSEENAHVAPSKTTSSIKS